MVNQFTTSDLVAADVRKRIDPLHHLSQSAKLYRRLLLLSTLVLLLTPRAGFAVEPGPEILLWPNGAPGSEGKTGEVKVRVTEAGDRVLSNIHKPSITPYLPAAGSSGLTRHSEATAVIVAPGGGHRELWSDHEGHNVARWLSDHGIAAFVLVYRLARETNSTYTVDDHAVADMQRALRLVRSRASEWGIATNRIGVMGFSAGGEVAFLSAQGKSLAGPIADAGNIGGDTGAGLPAVASDAPNNRPQVLPAFQALIYPGRSHRIEPSTNSPPVFMVCGYEDRPDISEGLASVYLKFKQMKVPAELHIYAGSGHGFGLRPNDPKPVGKWIERFEEWLADSGFLKKP
jgi:acetyl esterase/lipase